MKQPSSNKWIASLLLPIFFLAQFFDSSAVFAFSTQTAPVSLPAQFSDLQIPSALGEIRSVYVPEKPQTDVVYAIQDAHASLEAQKKIYQILKHLHHQGGIDALFIEGAEGPLNPRLLNLFFNMKTNRGFWDKLLEKGLINGAVYFLLNHQDLPAYGIEDASEYRANLDLYRSIRRKHPFVREFLEDLETRLYQTSQRVLPNTLLQFLKDWKVQYEPEAEWNLYLPKLFALSEKQLGMRWKDYHLQTQWPNLIRAHHFLEVQKSFPLKGLKTEQKGLALMLQGKNQEAMGQLEILVDLYSGKNQMRGALPFSVRKLSEVIFSLMRERGVLIHKYPNISRMLAYGVFQEEIRAEELFQEIRKLERTVFSQMAQNHPEAEFLIELYRYFYLLQSGFELELTREQVREFLDLSRTLSWKKVKAVFKTDHLRQEKIALGLIPGIFRFYELAESRESFFVTNINRYLEGWKSAGMKERPRRIAIVSGGYHIEGIQALLMGQKKSYGSIRPKLEESASSSSYQKQMLGDFLDAATLDKVQSLVMSNSRRAHAMFGPEAANLEAAFRQEFTHYAGAIGDKRAIAQDRSEVRSPSNFTRRTFLQIGLALVAAQGAQAAWWDPRSWFAGGGEPKSPVSARPLMAEEKSPFEHKDTLEIGIEDLDALIMAADPRIRSAYYDLYNAEQDKKRLNGFTVSLDGVPVVYEDGKFKSQAGATFNSGFGSFSFFGIHSGTDWTSAAKASLDLARAALGGYKNDRALLEEGVRFSFFELQSTFVERRELAITRLMRIAIHRELIRKIGFHLHFLEKTVLPATRQRPGPDTSSHVSKINEMMHETRDWILQFKSSLEEDSRELKKMLPLSPRDLSKEIEPKNIQFPSAFAAASLSESHIKGMILKALGPEMSTYQEADIAAGNFNLPPNRALAAQLSALRLAWLSQKKAKLGGISLGSMFKSFFDSFGRPSEDLRVRQQFGQSSIIPEIRERGYAKEAGGVSARVVLGGSDWRAHLNQAAATKELEAFRTKAVWNDGNLRIRYLLNRQTQWAELRGKAESDLRTQEALLEPLGFTLDSTGEPKMDDVKFQNQSYPIYKIAEIAHTSHKQRLQLREAEFNYALTELGLFSMGGQTDFVFAGEEIQGPAITKKRLPESRSPSQKPGGMPKVKSKPNSGKRSELRVSFWWQTGISISVAALLGLSTLQAAVSRAEAASITNRVSSLVVELDPSALKWAESFEQYKKNWESARKDLENSEKILTALQLAKESNPFSFTQLELDIERASFETEWTQTLLAYQDLKFGKESGPVFVNNKRHYLESDFLRFVDERVAQVGDLAGKFKDIESDLARWDKLERKQQETITEFLKSVADLKALLQVTTGAPALASDASVTLSLNGDSGLLPVLRSLFSITDSQQQMAALDNFWERNPHPSTELYRSLIEHSPLLAHAAFQKLIEQKSYSQLFELRAYWESQWGGLTQNQSIQTYLEMVDESIQDALAAFPDLNALANLAEKDQAVKTSIQSYVAARFQKKSADIWARLLIRQEALFEEDALAKLSLEKTPAAPLYYLELERRIALRLTLNADFDPVGKKTTEAGPIYNKGAEILVWDQHNRRIDSLTIKAHTSDQSVLPLIDPKIAKQVQETLLSMRGDRPIPLAVSGSSARRLDIFSNAFHQSAYYNDYWDSLGTRQRIQMAESYAQSGAWRELVRILHHELAHPQKPGSPNDASVALRILHLLSHQLEGRLQIAAYLSGDFTYAKTILSHTNGQGSLLELLQVDMAHWGRQITENKVSEIPDAWKEPRAAALVQIIYRAFLDKAIQEFKEPRELESALAHWLALELNDYTLKNGASHSFSAKNFSQNDIRAARDRELHRRTTIAAVEVFKLNRPSSSGKRNNTPTLDIAEYLADSASLKLAPDFRGMFDGSGDRQKNLSRQFHNTDARVIASALDEIDETTGERVKNIDAGKREHLTIWNFLQSIFQSVAGIPAFLIGAGAFVCALGVIGIKLILKYVRIQKDSSYEERVGAVRARGLANNTQFQQDLQGEKSNLDIWEKKGSLNPQLLDSLQKWHELVSKPVIQDADIDQLQLLFKAVLYHKYIRLGQQFLTQTNKDYGKRRNIMHDVSRLVSLTIEKLIAQYAAEIRSGNPPSEVKKQRLLSQLQLFLSQGRLSMEFMDGMRALDDMTQYENFYPEKFTLTHNADVEQEIRSKLNFFLRFLYSLLRKLMGIDGAIPLLSISVGTVPMNMMVAKRRFIQVFSHTSAIEPGLYSSVFSRAFLEALEQSGSDFFDKEISAFHEDGNSTGGRARRGFSRFWVVFQVGVYALTMLGGITLMGSSSWEVILIISALMTGLVNWIAHWIGNHSGLKSRNYAHLAHRFNVLEETIQELFLATPKVNALDLEVQEVLDVLKNPPRDLQIVLIQNPEMKNSTEWAQVISHVRRIVPSKNLQLFANPNEIGELSLITQAKMEIDAKYPNIKKMFLIVAPGSLEAAIIEGVDPRKTSLHKRIDFALGAGFRIAHDLPSRYLNIVAAAGSDRMIPVGKFDRRGFFTVAGTTMSRQEALQLRDYRPGIIGMKTHVGIHPEEPVSSWHQSPRSAADLDKFLAEIGAWVDPENHQSKQLISFSEVMAFSTDDTKEWALFNSALGKLGALIKMINESRIQDGLDVFPFDLEWEFLVPLIRELNTMTPGSTDKNPLGHMDARLADFPAQDRDPISRMFNDLYRNIFDRTKNYFGPDAQALNALKLTDEELQVLSVKISLVHPLYSTRLQIKSKDPAGPGAERKNKATVPASNHNVVKKSKRGTPPAKKPGAVTKAGVASAPVLNQVSHINKTALRKAVRNRLSAKPILSAKSLKTLKVSQSARTKVPASGSSRPKKGKVELSDDFFENLPKHYDAEAKIEYRILPVEVKRKDPATGKFAWRKKYLTIYGAKSEAVWNGTPSFADRTLLEALALFRNGRGRNAFADSGIKLADAAVFILSDSKPNGLPLEAREIVQAIRENKSVLTRKKNGRFQLVTGVATASITALRSGRGIRLASDFKSRSELRESDRMHLAGNANPDPILPSKTDRLQSLLAALHITDGILEADLSDPALKQMLIELDALKQNPQYRVENLMNTVGISKTPVPSKFIQAIAGRKAAASSQENLAFLDASLVPASDWKRFIRSHTNLVLVFGKSGGEEYRILRKQASNRELAGKHVFVVKADEGAALFARNLIQNPRMAKRYPELAAFMRQNGHGDSLNVDPTHFALITSDSDSLRNVSSEIIGTRYVDDLTVTDPMVRLDALSILLQMPDFYQRGGNASLSVTDVLGRYLIQKLQEITTQRATSTSA